MWPFHRDATEIQRGIGEALNQGLFLSGDTGQQLETVLIVMI